MLTALVAVPSRAIFRGLSAASDARFIRSWLPSLRNSLGGAFSTMKRTSSALFAHPSRWPPITTVLESAVVDVYKSAAWTADAAAQTRKTRLLGFAVGNFYSPAAWTDDADEEARTTHAVRYAVVAACNFAALTEHAVEEALTTHAQGFSAEVESMSEGVVKKEIFALLPLKLSGTYILK